MARKLNAAVAEKPTPVRSRSAVSRRPASRRGRTGSKAMTARVNTAWRATTPQASAHTPPSSSASPTATSPLPAAWDTMAAAMRARKRSRRRSRCSDTRPGPASAVTRQSVRSTGAASGSPVRRHSAGARTQRAAANGRVVASPSVKAVATWRSVSSWRCTSAAPRPRRPAVSARARKTSAMASSPKSSGVSNRTSTIAIASDSSACPPAVANAHLNPESARRVRPPSSGSKPPGRAGSFDRRIMTVRPRGAAARSVATAPRTRGPQGSRHPRRDA